jgi:hypothetical protein
MLWFVIGLLVLLVVQWVVFTMLVSFVVVADPATGRRRVRLVRWWKSKQSRQLGMMAILSILEPASLIALGTGHSPPLWVFAVLYGSINGLTARWMWLVWDTRYNGGRHARE